MLTQYDEFPVHQASRPFSHIPSTDYNWDEGYYFSAFSAEEKRYFLTGMRVNPNTDMIGGYAIMFVDGRQYTVRFSRTWRRECDTVIGPLKYRFLEPLKTIQLTLDKNESALSFDLIWTGVSPAFEEDHHTAESRGRLTTDQTRYTQPGTVNGHIDFEGKRILVDDKKWMGDRDHSWGLYAERRPLSGLVEWLPPKEKPKTRRALHFWTLFKSGDYSGFYHIHESETGEQCKMNDVFGSPFEGALSKGWDGPSCRLQSGRHDLRFLKDTRILKSGSIYLTEGEGRQWVYRFEIPMMPWLVQPMGYLPGSWKDGGTIHTYHGSEELAIEWDDFDFSKQPCKYSPYAPDRLGGDRTNEESSDVFGLGTGANTVQGLEYVAKIELISPEGKSHHGQGHIECFIDGRFDPYGFK